MRITVEHEGVLAALEFDSMRYTHSYAPPEKLIAQELQGTIRAVLNIAREADEPQSEEQVLREHFEKIKARGSLRDKLLRSIEIEECNRVFGNPAEEGFIS